jgi:hypothetical protein
MIHILKCGCEMLWNGEIPTRTISRMKLSRGNSAVSTSASAFSQVPPMRQRSPMRQMSPRRQRSPFEAEIDTSVTLVRSGNVSNLKPKKISRSAADLLGQFQMCWDVLGSWSSWSWVSYGKIQVPYVPHPSGRGPLGEHETLPA